MPFLCLDDIWQPSWTAADTPRFRELIADAHAGDAWISDGNYAAVSFDIRLPRADRIVWLDRPRLGCAWRAFARVFRAGEAHRVGGLAKVAAFIWNFNRVNRPRIEAARRRARPRCTCSTADLGGRDRGLYRCRILSLFDLNTSPQPSSPGLSGGPMITHASVVIMGRPHKAGDDG